MRKAILIRFLLVLLAALGLNSIIFYIFSSNMILNNTRRDMLYTLESLDSTLDYQENLDEQLQRLEEATDRSNSRFTLIERDGTVAADSQADEESLENHLERQEVAAALKEGSGYSKRYSQTLHETMLYVAFQSKYSDMILRMAVPFDGIQEYIPMLFPSALVSFLVAFGCALAVTGRFVASVTRPMQEIAAEMLKVKGDYSQLQFKRCKYPEVNVIAETTMKMAENVNEYLKQIEKEKQIRQEFFSNASHELKTPITSIQGYAELLESGMIQDEGMKKDFAKRIKKEAMNMTSLINDILMISRLETKEAEVVFSEVRISPLLEEIVGSLKPMAASSQVYIHLDCQPLVIYANAQQMRELLTNLISNAIKYNRPGGQVWVNIREQDKQMVIRVRDNGVGIPKDSMERIFERFYRVDKGRSRKQGGTGLGLSIVKHIVSFYHGSIRVTSRLDEGSEFIVYIPMTEQES